MANRGWPAGCPLPATKYVNGQRWCMGGAAVQGGHSELANSSDLRSFLQDNDGTWQVEVRTPSLILPCCARPFRAMLTHSVTMLMHVPVTHLMWSLVCHAQVCTVLSHILWSFSHQAHSRTLVTHLPCCGSISRVVITCRSCITITVPSLPLWHQGYSCTMLTAVPSSLDYHADHCLMLNHVP